LKGGHRARPLRRDTHQQVMSLGWMGGRGRARRRRATAVAMKCTRRLRASARWPAPAGSLRIRCTTSRSPDPAEARHPRRICETAFGPHSAESVRLHSDFIELNLRDFIQHQEAGRGLEKIRGGAIVFDGAPRGRRRPRRLQGRRTAGAAHCGASCSSLARWAGEGKRSGELGLRGAVSDLFGGPGGLRRPGVN
jgi:hypothetical protein